MTSCPHCGKPLEARPALTIAPATGMVRRGDRFTCLTSNELKVFRALTGAAPLPVEPAVLKQGVRGSTTVRKVIFLLRGKVPALGFRIDRVGRAGYRLVEKRP